MSRIARATGLYWTTVAFHVARLTASGDVRTVRGGRYRMLFPRGDDVATNEQRALLAEPSCRRVALAILAGPGLRIADIRARTGLSERAVYHHVKRLVEFGLVTRRTTGYRALEAAPRLVDLLGRDAPPFEPPR